MKIKSKSIYFLSSILAFCSFSYEILIAFTVANITSSTVLAQTVTLGSFIFGLGIGAYWIEKRKSAGELSFLIKIEAVLAVIGGASLFLVFAIHGVLLASTMASVKPMLLFLVQPISFLVGLLSGFELPLLIKMGEKVEVRENQVLGYHYAGVLFSSLLLLSFLIPTFDVLGSLIIVALINVCVALYLCFLVSKSYKLLASTGLAALVLLGLSLKHGEFYQAFLKMHYHRIQPSEVSVSAMKNLFQLLETRPEIERIRSHYQYIDIMEGATPELDQGSKEQNKLIVFLDFFPQFSAKFEKVYHEQMVHAPIDFFQIKPRSVLVLGGGDGLLVRELLKYEEVESIQLVELDPFMLKLAQKDPRFTRLNQSSLADPRVEILNMDAVHFLRTTNQLFDAILLDFPFPNNYDLSKLYSYEFYKMVISRLKDDGYIALDFPIDRGVSSQSKRNEIIFSTLHFAGFTNMVPFGKDDIFIMASRGAQMSFDHDFTNENLSFHSKRLLYMRSKLRDEVKVHRKYVNSIFKPKSMKSAVQENW